MHPQRPETTRVKNKAKLNNMHVLSDDIYTRPVAYSEKETFQVSSNVPWQSWTPLLALASQSCSL